MDDADLRVLGFHAEKLVVLLDGVCGYDVLSMVLCRLDCKYSVSPCILGIKMLHVCNSGIFLRYAGSRDCRQNDYFCVRI